MRIAQPLSWLASSALLLLWSGGAGAQPIADTTLRGYSPAAATSQLELEAMILERLDRASTARHFRFLTEDPHPAGSARNRELAEYIRHRFLEYGLEDVELLEYDVLLPWPREVSVRMIEPIEFKPSLEEDGYDVDKDSWDRAVGTTFIGMSGSGEITGDVIYVHSGNPEDYDWLESQGIDPKGKVAIVRYSMPYSYRGFKAWEAQRRGVAAMIIYSDPMEDGYRKGDVFPHGPWGPESHIQRGAITYDFLVPGDPLTPGWASTEGARRISRAEARSIPKIPVVPMSWRDAKPILEHLAGPVAPLAWQGDLPITYKIGPGPAKLVVKVAMDDEVRTIQVVTGKLRGTQAPDKVVVLGNHYDAWVYGGVDPSSGTATLLETARVLGDLASQGHRPRRSLLFAAWDAEEWHLTGSTEWGEQFADQLGVNAIAYLNVDSSTSGPDFSVDAVASLNPLIHSVARDVIDPNSRRSVLDAWQRRVGEAALAESPSMVGNNLGSGSDYTVFLNYLGIPVVDMTFDGPYGVYHSQYDDLYWMEHFGDPGFRYMTTMVEIWGRMALRLANADVYPYDFRAYAKVVGGFLDSLGELSEADHKLDLTDARAAVSAWSRAADQLDASIDALLRTDTPFPSVDLVELNQSLLAVERQFLSQQGIPDRPWFKHVLYAPRYTYAAMSLPGVREAAEKAEWETAKQQLLILVERLHAATAMTLRASEAASKQ